MGSVGYFVLFLVLCRQFSGLGYILVLQAAAAVHVGVDNLNVVRHVGRLVEGTAPGKPLELLADGAVLLSLVTR